MDEKIISIAEKETEVLSIEGNTPTIAIPIKEYAVITFAGPTGPAGSGDKTYTHDQMTAASIWTVNHNLGKFPSITVVDSSGSVVEGAIQEITANQIIVTFSAAFAGKAYCN